MDAVKNSRLRAWICLALAVATAAVFWQVVHHAFINYDDPDYVTENPQVLHGLTLEGIGWAFTHSHASNWHPLTWISHMLDCGLFGLNPGAHHAVNLLFHIANTLLLFLVLNRMTGALWRSAIVAGLFALHPLHVESVAWVAERKDVLSTFFGLLSLWAYGRYASARSPDESEGLKTDAGAAAAGSQIWTLDYSLALLFFAFGLMAKPMLITWPFVLLLLDYWPLQRIWRPTIPVSSVGTHNPQPFIHKRQGIILRRLLFEKWPWFALSLASSVVTFIVQKAGGSVTSIEELSVPSRVANVLIAYVRYLAKMLWPVDLAVIYPRPTSWPIAQVVGAGLLLALITAFTVRQARRRPYLLTGWLWYLGTLVPVIGLVQVGRQSLADRYTYIPLIGIFVAIVWGCADVFDRFKHRRLAAGLTAGLALALCAWCSVFQLGFWKDSLTLFGRALAVTTDNALAQNNFGTALAAVGKREEALRHYAEAARLDPGDALIQNNFGTALARAGQPETAVDHYLQAVRLQPKYAEAYNNLGTVLAAQGRLDDAIISFNRALKFNPDYAEARNDLGGALAMQGKTAEAVAQYNEALRLKPRDAGIHFNLGLALEKLGRVDEAITHFAEAVRIDPAAVEARYHLGRCLFLTGKIEPAAAQLSEVVRQKPDHAQAQFFLGLAQLNQGQTEGGIGHLREAIRLRPDLADPLNALAWELATDPNSQLRQGAEAVRLAEKAAELTQRQQPVILNTLAAAYAEAGRFDEAVATANQAMELARKAGQSNLVASIQSALDLYQSHQAFRQGAAP